MWLLVDHWRLQISKSQDAVELTFQPPRSWRVRAGQYIYIRVPAIRFCSFAESHPFCVVWWENGPDGKVVTISVLEKGFTRSLSTSRYNEVRILIDGPYGGPIDTKPYTGVAMMATGMVLLHVQHCPNPYSASYWKSARTWKIPLGIPPW